MSYIPKVEQWLEDARRRMNEWATVPNSASYEQAKKDVEMYEEMLARLRAIHDPQKREQGKK